MRNLGPRLAVAVALSFSGCSDDAGPFAAGGGGGIPGSDAGAHDSRAGAFGDRDGAHVSPPDAGTDAPSNPIKGDASHNNASPDATRPEAGIGPIPVDAATFRRSPVALSELIGTGSDSRAELVSRLRDRVPSTGEMFHPYSYDGTNWGQAADELIENGWKANLQPALPMVPPIDWGDGRGDENWHFQLNSLRPSIPFAYAAWQNGDATNLGRMLAIVDDWIDYNLIEDIPNGKRWYDHAAGLRAHYLGVVLTELLRRGPGTSDDVVRETFDGVVEKLVWTLHVHGGKLADPSFLPVGNHELFIALGLATVCRVVPEFEECEQWQPYAQDVVRRYVQDTISSEYVTLEHSPDYHRFVALSLRYLRDTGLFYEELKAVSDRMLEHLLWMYHPNAEIALVGDSSGHASLGLSAELDYVLTEGGSGVLPPAAPIGFYETGFAILRNDWSRHPFSSHSYLFFSASHHSAIHKHADDFTFEWSRRGLPIVIDSGRFDYTAGDERKFFVSTRAANTIEVDGTSHQVGGVAAYGSALVDVGLTPSGVQYTAAIAPRLPSDVVHARVLAMHDDWLLVADRLTATTEHSYRQWFGLHENFELVGSDSSPVFRDGQGNEVRLLPLVDHDAFESARGQTDPAMQGWISHEYQARVPRWSIASRTLAQNATMVTLLATPVVTTASAVPVADTLEITIESGGTARRYTIAFGQSTGSVTE